MKWIRVIAALWLLMSLCFIQTAKAQEPRVVILAGTPYEIGYQHGEALRDEVRAFCKNILSYFRRYSGIPILGPWYTNLRLWNSWTQSEPYVPDAYLEELQGLSDASGVPLRELKLAHAIPDRTYTCANLAVWGRATLQDQLIHLRNLDWNPDVGIQKYATIFVIKPDGKQTFVNVAWAGFIGVLTGINASEVSIGQIGAETVDLTYKGLPLVFLMRRVMEESFDLETAAQIIQSAPRTVGINYVVASAKEQRALAIETTHQHVAVFEANDSKEHGIAYAKPMADAVFRADTAMDPTIRDKQLASKGNPKKPGLETPGGNAYNIRYLGQAHAVKENYGELNPERVIEIAQSVAPDSNVQSVIFAWPKMWVANAEEDQRAALAGYHEFNLEKLLRH